MLPATVPSRDRAPVTGRSIELKMPRPHAAQRRIFRESARYNILNCGRRFGKTVALADRAAAPALAGWPVGWFAPKYKVLADAWRYLVAMLAPVTLRKNENEHRIELITGGSIECWTLEDSDAGRSRKYKRAIVDEAAMVESLRRTWQAAIRPTLTDFRGDAWLGSTPKGFNDFYDFWAWGQDPERKAWASWTMPSSANPYLHPDELAEARAELDPVLWRQEYEASFEAVQGRVYYGFSRQENGTDASLTLDGVAELLIGMDFNVNPMSAVVGKRVGDQLHVVDEFAIPDSNTEQMAQQILARYATFTDGTGVVSRRTLRAFPDPAGAARKTSAPVGQTDFTILKAHGFKVEAPRAAPPVADRINEVNALLCNAAGARRLYIHPRCTRLLKALDGLTYKEGTSLVDKSSGLDHITDALGYLVHSEFPITKREAHVRPLPF